MISARSTRRGSDRTQVVTISTKYGTNQRRCMPFTSGQNYNSCSYYVDPYFRQFGFETQSGDYQGLGATIYYHCFVKVCSSSNAGTCSTTTVSGSTATCSATPYAAPGRRRRADEMIEADAVDSAQIYVSNRCNGDFCEKTMVLPDQSEKTIDDGVALSDIGSDAITTTLSALTTALVLLG